jgi:hypothetical protein
MPLMPGPWIGGAADAAQNCTPGTMAARMKMPELQKGKCGEVRKQFRGLYGLDPMTPDGR